MKIVKKINFKKVKARNFLCFGKDGIELNFDSFGNIILIRGKNLDTARGEEETRISSNGSGKSSCPELLVYGLYGKTIKNPKKIGHKDVMHHNASKDLCVEVYWDQYKVERRRKPDSLRLWKSAEGKFDDSTEITLGGMPATQKEIENILGLNYETFINIVIFTDDNSTSFLECDASEKRSIIENLLSLEKYRTYHDNIKKIAKDHAAKIKTAQLETDFLEKTISDVAANIDKLKTNKKNWKVGKIEEVKKLGSELQNAESELSSIVDDVETKEYETAQTKMQQYQVEIDTKGKELEDINLALEPLVLEVGKNQTAKDSLAQEKQALLLKKQELTSNIKKISEVINKIEKLEPGVKCDHCFGEINPENYEKTKQEHQKLGKEYLADFTKVTSDLQNKDNEITEISASIQNLTLDLQAKRNHAAKINKEIVFLRTQINGLQKIKAPDNSIKKAGLNEKIKIIKENIQKIKNEFDGITPFDQMLTESELKKSDNEILLSTKLEDLKSLKDLTEYYAFWTIAFGDSGIRKYVIDEIIPALNSNINYWLQFLIDNKLEINFNNELEDFITKFPNDGKPFIYSILSNGQKRRINLALSQAFAHVMSLNTGRSPSLVFLDEVSSNIDPIGVEGIYNMICELSKDKKVFITTHDQDLLELLNGCQEINLVMEKGVSKLV